MPELDGRKVAVVATDGYEESELTEPVRTLQQAGADVKIVSLERRPIQGYKHHDRRVKPKWT